jgi:hypothetical protein
MGADGRRGDAELVRDFFGLESLTMELEHLPLAPGQPCADTRFLGPDHSFL